MKKNKIITGIGVVILGIIAVTLVSYTRVHRIEQVQFPILIAFFFSCGWILSLFWKRAWPYLILFILPTLAGIAYGYFSDSWSWLHFVGELIMIIPSFLLGFYFARWRLKTQLIITVFVVAFYLFYILKINPVAARHFANIS